MNKESQKMKIIGIDGNEANVSSRVGSNVFAYELLVAMHRYLQQQPLFQVVVYLSRPPQPDMPAETDTWHYRIIKHQPLWGVWRLPLDLWLHRRVDLFFSPGHYLPSISPVPMVSTIMDLAYERFPDYFRTKDRYQLQVLTRWGVKMARHVFAISEATRQDLISLYKKPAEDITVIYPAVSSLEPLKENVVQHHLKQLGIQGPYVLFVGTLQPRKNLDRLIRAFEVLQAQGFSGELVIAGRVGWHAEGTVDLIRNSVAHTAIHHLGFVDEQQKRSLLQGAKVLVLPGLYEGFGLPPLEAIQLGTLPLVSNVSSLPEVVPIEDLRFDPENVQDIAQAILRIWELSESQKQSTLKKLKHASEKFSWDVSAQKVCQRLAQEVEAR